MALFVDEATFDRWMKQWFPKQQEKKMNDSKAWDLGKDHNTKKGCCDVWESNKEGPFAVPQVPPTDVALGGLLTALKAAGWTPPPTPDRQKHLKWLLMELGLQFGLKVEVK